MIKFIAIVQIIGGLAGFLLLLGVASIQRVIDVSWVYYAAGGVFFLFSTAAGVMLIRQQWLGLPSSIIVQGAQVVRFATERAEYVFVSGPEVLLVFSAPSCGSKLARMPLFG